MTRSSAWLHSIVNDLRNGIKKEEYGVLGMTVVLGALLAATIGFIAVLRWEAAVIFAIISIPGGLLAGALSILWRQRHSEVQRPTMLQVILRFTIVLVSMDAIAGLARILPPAVFLIIVPAGVVAIATIARRVCCKQKKGGTDYEKRSRNGDAASL